MSKKGKDVKYVSQWVVQGHGRSKKKAKVICTGTGQLTGSSWAKQIDGSLLYQDPSGATLEMTGHDVHILPTHLEVIEGPIPDQLLTLIVNELMITSLAVLSPGLLVSQVLLIVLSSPRFHRYPDKSAFFFYYLLFMDSTRCSFLDWLQTVSSHLYLQFSLM